MAKQYASKYLPGQRTKSWLKLKCLREAEVVIGGATIGFGKREDSFGALIVGVPIDGRLVHCGEVGTGFTDEELVRLTRLLESVEQSDNPFYDFDLRTPHKLWCRPELTIKVSYLDLTDDGQLRHPSYQGLLK
jgi:bifunctional non-homologous end joining protein LigD